MEDKERFMKEALKQAKKGFDKGECPIGCVIVKDGKVLVRSHNMKLTKCNPILHAEVVAIDKACKKIGDWRLNDCDMYVTLEPCTMCSGAIVQSRIRKVYFRGVHVHHGRNAGNGDYRRAADLHRDHHPDQAPAAQGVAEPEQQEQQLQRVPG